MDSSVGFAPIAAEGIHTLILGSLPSQQSLEKQQYYGNPQNAFWRIMGELFGAGPDLPYHERTVRLTDHGIGVWDVLQSSVRPGSMDSDIRPDTAVANVMAKFDLPKDKAAAMIVAGNPMKRMIDVEEVATAALFLASDGASSVNGHALSVSGGEI